MPLTTRCPHCHMAFKVVADQLRVRNGLVRCGACGTVFDGRACLEGESALPTPAGDMTRPRANLPASLAPPAPQTPVALVVTPSTPSSPVFAPVAALPVPVPPAVSPAAAFPASVAPLPAPVVAPAPAPVAAFPAPAAPAENTIYGALPAVLRSRDGYVPTQAESPELVKPAGGDIADDKHDERAAAPPIRAYDPEDYPPEDDEPSFTVGQAEGGESSHGGIYGDVRTRLSSATDAGRAPPAFLDQDRLASQRTLHRVWGWLCLLGLLALVGQLSYVYRTPISLAAPMLRPAFEALCKPLNCTVGYARRIERIFIESSSLRPPQGGPQADDGGHSRLILAMVLRNRYDKDQEWPAIVLSLTDISDTVIARKIIKPEAYLSPGDPVYMAAGAEKTIMVPIVVDGLQVNGFQLGKFFP